ncbi:MAG: TetR/AcrR family transcriptional regulator [Kofleriaceae bacterium]|nr:TetR/AcrR family transcriptional regulator [Kofleriaceae bacterium]
MKTTRRSSAMRQVELTDAALHLIATHGIAALSTRSLAAHVGLSTGAIFRHFATLEDLLVAVVASVAPMLAETLPAPTLPARERLVQFIAARSEAVGKRVGILRLMVSDQFTLALPPRAVTMLASYVEQTRGFVLGCIREGQATGEFRRDIDAVTLGIILMGTMQMLALSTANRAATLQSVRAGIITLLEPPAIQPVSAKSAKPKKKSL